MASAATYPPGDKPYESRGGAPLHTALTPGGHVLDTSQPGWGASHRRLANPAPLGLMAFATTTLLLSFINVQTRNVTVPNIVVSMALAYGGLCQLLAGMWEGATGNTFGFTAFSSYGGFWLAYAAILWPTSQIPEAYSETGDFHNALGLFLAVWFLVTFIFLIASLRSSIGLILLFAFLDMTFLLLAIGELLEKVSIAKAGGAFGILTAFIAYYNALAGLLTSDTSFFILPVGDVSPSKHGKVN